MGVRQIFCKGCNKYLGEIRDATLRKGIVYLCDQCETKRLASDLAQKSSSNPFKDVRGMDFFNDVFSKKDGIKK